MGVNFNMLFTEDIVKAVKELTAESSKLKLAICKSIIQNNSVDKNVVNRYISYVNDILAYWEELANDLAEKMKSSKGITGIRTVEYEFVKDFIYCNYDYASILQFTDGLIKGINEDGKFKSPEDINDFFSHTISKAFNDRSDSVAGLLDCVIMNNGSSMIVTDNSAAKMYDSVKSYSKLFNSRDRIEIYKSIQKTIEFICMDKLKPEDPNPAKMNLVITMINCIVEYMTYSITAYITRIFIIDYYAYPFIDAANRDTIVVRESVDDTSSVLSETSEITLMRDFDDGICKDVDKVKELIGQLEEFTTMMGADRFFGTDKPSYDKYIRSESINNKFSDKLISNGLYDFIKKMNNSAWSYNETISTRIQEINNILKSSIYSTNHAIQDSSTPKQEILHVIRGTSCNETINGYQELSADLLKFSYIIIIGIEKMMTDMKRINLDIIEYPSSIAYSGSINLQNTLNECTKILKELYGDIALAIVNKGRDIEVAYNKLKSSNVSDILRGFKINIDNVTRKPTTTNSTNSVPDTLRAPVDLVDMYSLPAFESMQMYSEYVSSLPMFENDPYFTESAISTLMNAIKSLFKGIFKYFETAYLDKSFQAAINYTTQRESELLSLQFNNVKMKVLPYKNNDNINPPKAIWENIQNAINNLDTSSVKSKEDVSNFIKTLYPNEEVYGWFYGNNGDAKSGGLKFKNWILFEDNLNSVKDTEYQPIEIGGNEVKTRMKNWIDTVKGSRGLYDQLKKIDQDFTTAISGLEAKLVNMSNNTQQSSSSQNQDNNTPPPAPNPGSDSSNPADNKGSNSSQQTSQSSNNNSNGDFLNTLLTEVQTATERMWSHTMKIFVVYLRTEYGYIREAYTQANRNKGSK